MYGMYGIQNSESQAADQIQNEYESHNTENAAADDQPSFHF